MITGLLPYIFKMTKQKDGVYIYIYQWARLHRPKQFNIDCHTEHQLIQDPFLSSSLLFDRRDTLYAIRNQLILPNSTNKSPMTSHFFERKKPVLDVRLVWKKTQGSILSSGITKLQNFLGFFFFQFFWGVVKL